MVSSLTLFSSIVPAQAAAPLITQPVNETNLVTLFGNTRPEAKLGTDLGRVSDSLQLQHMLLQLKRSPQQEAALSAAVDALYDKSSPTFHQWLTPAQFGQQYGLASQDLYTISGWLTNHGFTVNVIYPSGILIDFSGTAGQVAAAFHTEIHNLNVSGTRHIANMSDPKIPAALAPAIAGVVSLHDFMPHPAVTRKPSYTVLSSGEYPIVPGDLQTIYNITPVYSNKITGSGQTIAVLEDTDVYSAADYTTFRSTFGLTNFPGGAFTQIHPTSSGVNNCTDPGTNSNDFEAILDAEYANASAPSASIELASCSDTATTFGGLLALQNIVNSNGRTPSVISISYAECEAYNGQASNFAFLSVYKQAVSQGISVYVAAGDWGAAVCDAGGPYAQSGINVSGLASSPYNVAVGGTDFTDFYSNTTTQYFRSTNTKYYESAKSYIPEAPWNDSCASTLLANYYAYSATYGSDGFCNSADGQFFIDITSGSGGPSGCAIGAASTPGVVSGSCRGYPKPAYQSGLVGNPNDGVRDLPDVSLFASNGFLFHYYPVCYSDPNFGGPGCAGDPSTWAGAGGTSFASPIFAGIQALVNQSQGSRQGNPNPVFYSLAKTAFGAGGSTACNSTLGNGVATTCTFYDVTQGDMDIPCYGTIDCYDPSGTFGVLSTSTAAYQPAYPSTTGWDFATGIGTVNVANLVANWSSAR